MSLAYKILGQELVSYTDIPGTPDTTSYYVGYEETLAPIYVAIGTNPSTAAYTTDGSTWTLSALPSTGGWEAITYGDGKFVALNGQSGVEFNAAYSTDGINWIGTTYPDPNGISWRDVVYGSDRFVAIATYSSMYSTDGINWTLTSSNLPFSVQFNGLAYGAGKFVITGSNNNIAAYSTDGITWTQTTMPTTGYWNAVAYGDGKFVALDSSAPNANFAYSTDGISWTGSTMTAAHGWNEITYGDGKFVAVGFGGGSSSNSGSAYSADGINWTFVTMPSYEGWKAITYGDGKFVVVSYASDKSAYSTDGITWTMSLLPYNIWRDVAAGQNVQLTETLNIIGGQGTAATEELLPITFYTVPEGKQTTVTGVFVANHNSTATTYDFAVVPAGEELSLKHHLRWDMEIAANDFENISTKITMSAGDSLVIFPSTVDTVSVTAFGVEK